MKKNRQNLIALVISLCFVSVVFYNIDIKQLLSTFSLLNWKILLLACPVYLLSLFLRGIRWKKLLPQEGTFSAEELSCLYSTGTALNIFFPARAGDFFRAIFLGKKYNFSKLKILSSIFLEKTFDGLTVVSLLLIGALFFQNNSLITKLSESGFLLFGGCLCLTLGLLKLNNFDKISEHIKKTSSDRFHKIIDFITIHINSFKNGLIPVLDAKIASSTAVLSIIIWVLECVVINILLLSFGFEINYSASLFVTAFVSLSTIIPSTSIFIGPYQYAFILALGLYNIDKTSALAVAFTQQSITIIIVSIITLAFFMKNNIKFEDIKDTK